MNSKEALEELKKLIPFKEEYVEKVIQCDETIYQDLERLEKLEKVIEILKDRLGLYICNETFGEKTIYALMSKTLGICISNHTEKAYELLREVLENDK